MNTELMEALTILEKEKNISKDVMMDAIENSLISACKNHFGTAENIKVIMDRETCDYAVYAEKKVVEEVTNPALEISLEEAEKIDSALQAGDIAQIPVQSKEFGRIATQNAKNLILQKIREDGKNISINLGRADAMLTENEQVKGEVFKPTDRIKLYVVEVKNTPRGPKILVSRTHPELVKRLFEAEVAEVRDGTVEIKSIAREAGSRTKMAVWSNDPNVDPVGACVGMNGARVNAVVQELRGEKIDIINWDENPALLIENALSPAKVISVMADPEEKVANVIVPDYQLSLAIGKEGQNARLAARLTGYKIDIKSETQAIEAGDLPENYMEQMGLMGEEGYTGDYEDEYEEGAYEDGAYDEYEDGAYGENDGYAEDYDDYSAEEPEEIEFVETDK